MPVTINGTTGIAGVDGSAGTPAVQGADSNTGVFFPAADTVAVATGGSERVRVDSSGNVGVGTSSPGTKLEINTGSSYSGVRLKGTSSASTGFEMTLGSNGKTGYLWNYENDSLLFATNNAERARIDSSGKVLINETSRWRGNGILSITTGADDGIAVKTDSAGLIVRKLSYTNSYLCLWENSGGSAVGSITTNGTNTTYATSSDYRLKENIQPMQNALNVVAQLKPVTYNWKADGSVGQGFIAHELQAIVPDAVVGEKDAVDTDGNPEYQGIDTSFLVATLTAAIQELKAELDTAKARIAALEAA